MTENVAGFWDAQAAEFDDEPDHGLRDAIVRAAWKRLLLSEMPAAPASVVDLGCGTGSLCQRPSTRTSTGVGLRASDTAGAVRRHRGEANVTALEAPDLWGGPITDERYLVVSRW